MERLDKIISERSLYSRKEAKELIRLEKIKINGVVCTLPETKVNETDTVLLPNDVILGQKHVYIVLNKPKGYVSATTDACLPTVLDLVPEKLKTKKLFPAGRLDKDTTGLMIITDDGDFAHRILAPRKHVSKTYEVLIDIPVTNDMKTGFQKGVMLCDGETKSANLFDISGSFCRVTITEGRYHQIKRMFGCFGAKVIELKRISIGNFTLPNDLLEGNCRFLTSDEIDQIERSELI